MGIKLVRPFSFGSTVSTDTFTDRKAEAKKLRSNLVSGINTIIISPRRWGKSSLVEKVMNDIRNEHQDIGIVSVDLFAVSSKEEFLELFAQEVITAASTKWEERLEQAKTIFKSIVPKISVSPDPNSTISLGFDWNELTKHQREILDLPETLAHKKGLRFIVCVDEFQDLANLSEFQDFEKNLRSYWQRHKHVTYCLYGSKRHMMTEIFNRPSQPFYRFGDIMMLPKISREKWVSFICDRFRVTGKSISVGLADSIASLMQDHSWYVQQLAHYTWNTSDVTATEDSLRKALRELIDANSPLFLRNVEIMSNTQVNLLKALLNGESQLTSTRVMQKYHLGTPRNVAKNRDMMIQTDVIEKTPEGYKFLDPPFELWLKERLMGISVESLISL